MSSTKCVITNAGMNLLQSTPASGQSGYWIGYYGLAFVPSGNRATGGSDEMKATMSTLTTTGDHIYNLWQGAMSANGLNGNSAASDLYRNGMYGSKVTTRYRYVVDNDGNNNLVMWHGTDDSSTSKLVGATVYRGVSSTRTTSEIPLPAPLFYMGDPVESYYRTQSDTKQTITGYTGDEDIDYPTIVIDGVKLPMVSTDTRNYTNSSTNTAKPPTNTDAGWGNSSIDLSGKYEWCTAKSTYTQLSDAPGSLPITNDANRFLKQYWKMQSISNYNRFSAPVSAEGYQVDYEPSCRNISKVTRFFPISHYQVLSAGKSTASSSRQLANALQFTLNIDLNDIDNSTTLSTITYEETTQSPVKDMDGKGVYSTTKSSFKFNRIGLYAVPMTIHRYKDEYASSTGACGDYKIQFQVDGDAEPVLFAVIDLAQAVTLAEGELSSWEFKVDLNMANYADADGSVIRDAAIYYNMYEDDAITWYKNQLIASASTSEAVTSLGIEIGRLKSRVQSELSGSSSGSCGSTSSSGGDLYALKNHTHEYMKNLLDSTSGDRGVRGIDTVVEGSDFGKYMFVEPTIDPAQKAADDNNSLDKKTFVETGSTRKYYIQTTN